MSLQGIRNIIFDLGGVILNLDTAKTHNAFADLAGTSGEAVRDSLNSSSFFNDYEKGLLSDTEFRTEIRKLIGKEVTDDQIDKAWNAMLGAMPSERLDLLKKLSASYRLFLLSNTNNIHLTFLNGIVRSVSGHADLAPWFERDYYSHLLKMRKPDVEIFKHVLSQHELIPSETLFLDDNRDNLKGAEEAGIRVAHVAYPDMIFSILA